MIGNKKRAGWDRARVLILEAAAISAIIGGLGFPAEWFRQRINAKISADQSIAASLKSLAESVKTKKVK